MSAAYVLEARQELEQAVRHYEALSPDLAIRFALSFEEGVARALEYPKAYPIGVADARCVLLDTFPYGVIDRIEDDELRI